MAVVTSVCPYGRFFLYGARFQPWVSGRFQGGFSGGSRRPVSVLVSDPLLMAPFALWFQGRFRGWFQGRFQGWFSTKVAHRVPVDDCTLSMSVWALHLAQD